MRLPLVVPDPRPGGAAVVGIGQGTIDHLCLVESFPTPDTKQRLAAYEVQPGGQVATALAALGRWGVGSAYIGAFGDDPGGDAARASLVAHGVDVAAAVVRPGCPTQLSVVLVERPSAERTVLWHRDPRLALASAEIPRPLVCGARALLIDGVDVAAATTAAAWARAAGVPVVADVDGSCADPAAVLPLVDALLVSGEFARAYTGAREPAAALRALASGGAALVGITLGREGAMVAAGERVIVVPGYRVAAVDTTGAGDLFHAGFLWGMLHHLALESALRFANAAAALQCTRLGGRAAIPALDDVRALAAL